ncbi:MAG: hypothetical protein WC777_00905 [Candidatus Gracilibacteria bacterium]|jgi:hypothetical protein
MESSIPNLVSLLALATMTSSAHAGKPKASDATSQMIADRVVSLLRTESEGRFSPPSQAIPGLSQSIALKLEDGALVSFFECNAMTWVFKDQAIDGTADRFSLQEANPATVVDEDAQAVYSNCVLPLAIQSLCMEPKNAGEEDCQNLSAIPLDQFKCLEATQAYIGTSRYGYR